MLSSGTTCYHLGWNVIIWDAMLSSAANVIIWDKMLSSEANVLMVSSGANVIIWDKMLSSGANVIMVSSGANVIIWCYHVMLASGMITPPFFVFPGNFTLSFLHMDIRFGHFCLTISSAVLFWKRGSFNEIRVYCTGSKRGKKPSHKLEHLLYLSKSIKHLPKKLFWSCKIVAFKLVMDFCTCKLWPLVGRGDWF